MSTKKYKIDISRIAPGVDASFIKETIYATGNIGFLEMRNDSYLDHYTVILADNRPMNVPEYGVFWEEVPDENQ